MRKSDLQKMYLDFLREEGYQPKLDSDGDVAFKREGMYFVIIVDEGDPESFRLALPNFWHFENERDRLAGLKASVSATGGTKVAKVYPVRDNMWATAEMFVDPPENFKPVFQRACSALMSAVMKFASEVVAVH